MRRLPILLLLAAACAAPTAPAASAPAAPPPDVRTERIEFFSGGDTFAGEIFLPSGEGPHPGLVVVHEWWGLNDQVRGEARRLAAEGYAALAVDLYRGRAAADRDEAHELSRGLPEDRAARDLRAAFAALAGRPDVAPGRIGVIGWCMGGGYAVTLATVEPHLAACVVFYGRLPTDTAVLARIEAPVLGLFGAEDRGIPPEAVRAFEAALRDLGKEVETVVYDGAGHAFANETRESHRPEAAADARRRTLEFLRDRLGDAPPLRPVTGAALRDRVHRSEADAVLVNVWATWCLPCREEFPDLVRLAKARRGRGLEVLLVSADFPESAAEARRFLADQGVDFPTYLKTGKDGPFIEALSPDWTGALPATFVFDREGVLRDFWEGKASYDRFERSITEVTS